MRKGLGRGQGTGYKNILPSDAYIHSLSARGVKSSFRSGNYETLQAKAARFDTHSDFEKQGLIKEIARKVVDGAKWAIEWEKEHLPKQKAWVKKEFEDAKEFAHRVAESAKTGVKSFKDRFKEEKQNDLHDVRDELDTDNDGDQDISSKEFKQENAKIQSELNDIDLDNDGTPDHIQDQTFKMVREEEVLKTGEIKEEHHERPLTNEGKTEGSLFGFLGRMPGVVKHETNRRIQQYKNEGEYIRSLPDSQLDILALKEGRPLFFGLNKYESEIIRRRQERIRIASLKKGKLPARPNLASVFRPPRRE